LISLTELQPFQGWVADNVSTASAKIQQHLREFALERMPQLNLPTTLEWFGAIARWINAQLVVRHKNYLAHCLLKQNSSV